MQFPRAPRPGRIAGLPGHPAVERNRRKPQQLCRLRRIRRRPVREFHRDAGRPVRAFHRLRQYGQRQARAAVPGGPRLRLARVDFQRLPGTVAAPAILHHHIDQLHLRRTGRHQHGSGRERDRTIARGGAAEAREIGQHQRRRDRQSDPGAEPDRRFLPDQDYRPDRPDRESDRQSQCAGPTDRCEPRLHHRPDSQRRGFQQRWRGALLHQRSRHHHARGRPDRHLSLYHPRSRSLEPDRGGQHQQDQDRQANRRAGPAGGCARADPVRPRAGTSVHQGTAQEQGGAERRRRNPRLRDYRANHALRQGAGARRGAAAGA